MLILNSDFNYMQQYDSCIKSKQQQKQMKYKLLDIVEAVYGETFNRLKSETRHAIDTLCFLATDKGFIYAKDTYFAQLHNLSTRTIRRVMKTLQEAGKVVKKHRSSSRHNGRGAAVYFFVDHPYFSIWAQYFNFDVQTDVQAEKAEKPCASKNKEAKKVSTYYLPNNYIKDHIMYKTIPFVKGVPKLVNQTFKDVFKDSLRDLYLRVRMAYHKVLRNISYSLSIKEIHSVAYESIHTLFTYLKTSSMSLEEQCKLVYRIAFNKFNTLLKCKGNSGDQNVPYRIVRKEMLPDWFKETQEVAEQEVSKIEDKSEEAEMVQMRAILAHYK
ncbi:hypothetical protein [Priestia filamentosa]|uniref:hypothetical protein n=1 Tax=Priestia filamentosa TaxID=1402861 RepID=UPI00397B5E82